MSSQKRIAFAMIVSWVSNGFSILAALLLIPTLYRYMSREELGVWYLLGNSQAFIGLFGFGLAPVLTRQIALLVKSTHLDQTVELVRSDEKELEDLLYTGRIALRWMAVATMVVSWIAGYFLLKRIPLVHVTPSTLFWAWTLMCLGWSFGVWMSYLDCWVAGIGYVGSDALITVGITFGTTISYILAVVVWHRGLMTLASISLGSVFIQRLILILFLRSKGLWRAVLPGKWSSQTMRRLTAPSLRLWGTAVGAFLIYKTDQYFIAVYLGTTVVALYQSTYNTVMTLALNAGSATASVVVFISHLWAEGNFARVQQLMIRGCRLGFVILVTGELFLMISGKEFFTIWLKGSFIGYPLLFVLLFSLGLDTQHGLLTNVSRATEDERYALPALAGGALNFLFTWLLIRRIGVIGVPLGTLFAQLLTNNWYGVYRPLTRIKFPFKRYLLTVIFPVLIFALVSGSFILAVKIFSVAMWGQKNWVVCGATFLGCCSTGLFGIWISSHLPFSATEGLLGRWHSIYERKVRINA